MRRSQVGRNVGAEEGGGEGEKAEPDPAAQHVDLLTWNPPSILGAIGRSNFPRVVDSRSPVSGLAPDAEVRPGRHRFPGMGAATRIRALRSSARVHSLSRRALPPLALARFFKSNAGGSRSRIFLRKVFSSGGRFERIAQFGKTSPRE